jgi:hypothetical protein
MGAAHPTRGKLKRSTPPTSPKMTRRERSDLLSAAYHAARTLAAWLILAALFTLLCFVP